MYNVKHATNCLQKTNKTLNNYDIYNDMKLILKYYFSSSLAMAVNT